MSLRAFHIVFVTAALIVMLGFGTWCVTSGALLYGTAMAWTMGGSALAVGALLIVYAALYFKKLFHL